MQRKLIKNEGRNGKNGSPIDRPSMFYTHQEVCEKNTHQEECDKSTYQFTLYMSRDTEYS